MHRRKLLVLGLLALVSAVVVVGGVKVYASLIWGGVPVNVSVSDDRLAEDEETQVQFELDDFSAGTVEIKYSDSSGASQLWKEAFVNPPTSVWANENPLKLKLRTKDSFSFTQRITVEMWLEIESTAYPNVKAIIKVEPTPAP